MDLLPMMNVVFAMEMELKKVFVIVLEILLIQEHVVVN